MLMRKSRTALVLAAVAFAVSGPGWPVSTGAQPPVPDGGTAAHPECTIDLALPGKMRDILSNALVRGLKRPAQEVAAFLEGAEERYAAGDELLKAAAAHFKLPEEVLAAKVEKYRHCNCTHPVESALHPTLKVDPQAHPSCTVDLELAGKMSDIVSNALVRGLQAPEQDVRAFLDHADQRFEDGPEVLKSAAAHFKISEDVLAAEVLKFKHCNCTPGAAGDGTPAAAATERDDGLPVSAFAKDVTVHVVLHELGHALIREFDIPILANEETMADAFATYYLTTYMPDRAADILTARVTSLMIEAGEESAVKWGGEHDHDARRANQVAALAVAADPAKYKAVADIVGMSDRDIRRACDYGAEIRRSWRRVLTPLWMPEGAASGEARVVYEESNGFLNRLCADGLATELETAIKRFDWHSQVTIRFVEGDGGAQWSRSGRTITVHSSYVRRFINQGERGLPSSSD